MKAIAWREISPAGPCGPLHMSPSRKAPALCGARKGEKGIDYISSSGSYDGWPDAACSGCMNAIIRWCDEND